MRFGLAACVLFAAARPGWAGADPTARLVMVQTAAWASPTGSRAKAIALWRALVARYAE